MDIAIIGAGGSVGRTVAQLIVEERLLQCDERLVLVGNPKGASAKSLYGFAVDLMDGYAEICPKIEVAMSVEDIGCDLVVMAGGATIPLDSKIPISRDFLAGTNMPIFESYASALARHSCGSEIVLCISNPNELAVAVFAKHLGRKRVIGMGAFLDSLRFRKEIAIDLGIRRQSIHGFMVGEHDFNAVPLWSSVHIFGYNEEQLRQKLLVLRKGHETIRFHSDVDEAVDLLRRLISQGNVREAFATIDRYPPDIRVALKPFVTHFSGSKTVMGTAKATLELLRTITLGVDALVSGQVALEGEFYDIHGTIGVPFVIGNQGVDRIIHLQLTEDEKALLVQSAKNVEAKIKTFVR